MLYGSQITGSGLSVTSLSSCKKHLDSSGRHTVEDVITSFIWKLVGSQERPQGALTKGCVGPEHLFFQLSPPNLCLLLTFFCPWCSLGAVQTEDLSANLGFPHSQQKQRIKLTFACLKQSELQVYHSEIIWTINRAFIWPLF